MSDAAQTAQTAASEQEKPRDYDAFLSYTHRDRPVVAGIQKGNLGASASRCAVN